MKSTAETLEDKFPFLSDLRAAATEKMVMFTRLNDGRQRFLFADNSFLDFWSEKDEEADVSNEVYFNKCLN